MQLDPQTLAADRTAALDWLWQRVLRHVGAMQLGGTGPAYAVGHDDAMMCHASSEDALAWLDDCEARLGCDVALARAAMGEFLAARDGAPGTAAVNAAMATPLYLARGRLHSHHPVIRGLHAIADRSAAA